MGRYMAVCGLALGLLGCEKKIEPKETGIRGRVLVGTEAWVPKPGEMMCASEHEKSEHPICGQVGLDGSFEIVPLPPGTYWLCRQRDEGLDCPSLCPYTVRDGEVIEVDALELLQALPGEGGFYGTSIGSFGEPGYLDVAHPLRVCVGPPDTPTQTPVANLKCVETDRCGHYVLGVPRGSYRVLFAEIGDEMTSYRQPCVYHVFAYGTFEINRATGRSAENLPVVCPEESTPDPPG